MTQFEQRLNVAPIRRTLSESQNFYYIIQLNSRSKENVIKPSHIHKIAFISSGSERCSTISVDNSIKTSGVLIPLVIFTIFFVGVLSACLVLHYFVKTNNILHLILCLPSHIRFWHVTHSYLAFCKTSLNVQKYGLRLCKAFPWYET